MFAGLVTEGDDSDANSTDADEEVSTTATVAPAKAAPAKPAVPRAPAHSQPASLLPEADEDEDDEDDEDDGRMLPSAQQGAAASIFGDVDVDDLRTTIATLKAVAQDLTLFRSKPFKALREAIGPLAQAMTGEAVGGGGGGKRGGRRGGGAASGTKLDGLSPLERYKQMDRDALNHRVLRAERLARLEELQQPGNAALLLTNSGGDDPSASLNAAQSASLVPFQAKAGARGGRGIGAIPDGPALAFGTADDGAAAAEAALLEAAPATLHLARSCYICKRPYRELHAFYAQLCMGCAEFNWIKRTEKCNLYGRVALVTGARVKIGFRIALKLLRCGCEVIATTRFPIDSVRRFAAEEDHPRWQHRLHIIGADLRDLKGLEALCDALPRLVRRLDIIINNACQTVRRPPQYYQPLLVAEVAQPEEAAYVRRWTAAHVAIRALAGAAEAPALDLSDASAAMSGDGIDVVVAENSAGGRTGEGILPGMTLPVSAVPGQSAMLSQLAIVPGDDVRDDAAFPQGRTDGNSDLGQQLDLRAKNSWMLKLEEVSTPEMAEVLAINALAPAVINGRLRAFMQLSGAPTPPPLPPTDAADEQPPTEHSLKFIVNVSAMEGRFYKFKQPTHPHTNMAKAALNMMTRTSAADYAKGQIYMTAVDTGWINDEKPAAQAAADAQTHNFQTPIDEIDAAARVLDPIIAPLRRLAAGEDPRPEYGVFLKDYAMCEW